MKAGGNGTFMVWEWSPPDTYAMTLVFQNKPTHHLITMIDGLWTINKKPYTKSSNMFTMITALGKEKVKGWPVVLGPSVPSSASRVPPSFMPAGSVVGGGGGGGSGDGSGGGDGSKYPPWLHGSIGQEAAVMLLEQHGLVDGTFLVWQRWPHLEVVPGTTYVLSVVFKGKPTHHALMTDPSTGRWTINKTQFATKHSDLFALITELGKKGAMQGWPVVLNPGVPVPQGEKGPDMLPIAEGAGKGKFNADAGGDRRPLSGAVGGTGSDWLHGSIGKADAKALVAGKKNGTFLVWEFRLEKDKYALTVVYKGTPTHHQVIRNKQGIWMIGNSALTHHTDMIAMINALSVPGVAKGWPVPLAFPVPCVTPPLKNPDWFCTARERIHAERRRRRSPPAPSRTPCQRKRH